MANEDSVLKEVDQELAEDRQWAMFRKYGPAAMAGALAIVVGVGGWQFWNGYKDRIAKEQALEYRNAVDLLVEDADGGRAALGAIAEGEASGYSVLSELQRAASYARDGERVAAIAAFEGIYTKGSTPKRVKDLARLRAAYLSLNDGRDAVMKHLGGLPNEGGAFSYHASEVSGLAALEAKDYETALSIFRLLSVDLAAPAAVKARAEDFAALAASGKAGVNITGELRVDDLLDAIGAGDTIESDLGAVTGDAGVDDVVSEIEAALDAAADDVEPVVETPPATTETSASDPETENE